MCLQTTWKKAKRATKNITVYKELNKITVAGIIQLRSTCENFPYELKKLYKTKMKLGDDCPFDDKAQNALVACKEKYKSIGAGFHSAKSPKRYKDSCRPYFRVIVQCIIPKGALYYEGLSDLLVSDQIKIMKVVE